MGCKRGSVPCFTTVAQVLFNRGKDGAMKENADWMERRPLDFFWKFARGDFSGAQKPGFDDSGWRKVRLPHDWSVEGPFERSNLAGGDGAYLPGGVGWYRRELNLPAACRGKKIFAKFDGIYMNSEVWMNGNTTARHWYGYTGFQADLTPFVNFGGKNVLAVRVDNSRQPNSRWYSGSGIYRHAWLSIKDPVHIARNGVFLSTSEISSEQAELRLETALQNESGMPCEAEILFELRDETGRLCVHAEKKLFLEREAVCRQRLSLPEPILWSDRRPYLYRAAVTVRSGGTVRDRAKFACGIRSAVFDADRGFLLNGEPVKLKGVCLHHDGGCVGSAVPERVWERRLRLLREMGCNAVRTSHNPPAPEFLDLLDRMGFLAMDEAFDEWRVCKTKNIMQQDESREFGYCCGFDDNAEENLTEMIRRDRNHPCVVLWSVGNEIPEQSAPEGTALLRRLVSICRREDPYRMVTSACDRIAAEPEAAAEGFLNTLDVVGYNYVDRWRGRAETFYAEDRARFPERRFLGSENRSVPGVRGEYSFAAGGWEPYFSAMIPSERLWRFNLTHDYVAGDFIWTGIDYLGEAQWPAKSASFAPLDTCGFRKDSYYFYQSIWTEKPMAHLFPHWNWPGREGRIISMLCYTNCESVELFLNGRPLGEKCREFPARGMTKFYGHFDRPALSPTTGDLHLSWDVPYEPGTLLAVGKNGGREVCRDEVHTAGEPFAVVLSADRGTVAADACDVFHVTVRIADRQGVTVPDAACKLNFHTEGPCELLGVDSGDPKSHELFQVAERRAFHGLCLAVVRSGSVPGEIRVTVSADGLRSASVTVKSVPAKDCES